MGRSVSLAGVFRMVQKTLLVLLTALVMGFGPPAVLAQVATGQRELVAYVSTEQFQWQESTPQNPEFLTETGTLTALGVAYSNASTLFRGIYSGVDARIYGGAVDYTGHAISLTGANAQPKPFDSSTGYLANRIQLDAGYRFPLVASPLVKSFDIAMALGSDYRERDIGGGALADGTPVQGYLETYHDIYMKAGLGMALHTGTQVHKIAFGIKRPLRVNEVVHFDALGAHVRLAPQGETSTYATWQIYPATPRSSALTLSLYIEQTKYSRSPDQGFSFTLQEKTHYSSIYQPDSELSVTGLSMLWRF